MHIHFVPLAIFLFQQLITGLTSTLWPGKFFYSDKWRFSIWPECREWFLAIFTNEQWIGKPLESIKPSRAFSRALNGMSIHFCSWSNNRSTEFSKCLCTMYWDICLFWHKKELIWHNSCSRYSKPIKYTSSQMLKLGMMTSQPPVTDATPARDVIRQNRVLEGFNFQMSPDDTFSDTMRTGLRLLVFLKQSICYVEKELIYPWDRLPL